MAVAEKTTATIDLDAIRAARGEADGEHIPTIRVTGKVWQLPASLPAEFLFRVGTMQAGDLSQLEGLLRMVFGDDFEEITAQLTVADMKDLLAMLPEVYAGGGTAGELPDSQPQ